MTPNRKPLTPEEREAKAAAKREQDRLRQREKRKRDSEAIVPFPGRAPRSFIEAMKARAIFYGATEQKAERDADDPKKIAALAFHALDYFAANWYLKK